MVTKYRRNILKGVIAQDVMQIIRDISMEHGYEIDIMETDKNHIHLLVESKPILSSFAIVHKLKQISTFRIWKKHGEYLKQIYWRENTLWSDGYFVCSIGEANAETIRKYIEEQC